LKRLENLHIQGYALMKMTEELMGVIAERMPKKRGPPFLSKDEYLVHKIQDLLKQRHNKQEREGRLSYVQHLVKQMITFTRIALDPKTFFARGEGENLMRLHP
jgi:hypothetical protein